MNFSRFAASLLAIVICISLPAIAADVASSDRARGEDFDAAWRAIDQGYAYFGTTRTAWHRVRDKWRPRALAARSREQFVAVLESTLAQLRDDHVVLSERSAASPRWVPAEIDIWASWRDDAAVIEGVQTYGEADVAGRRPGNVVTSVAGAPPARAVRELLGEDGATPAARDWALRHVLAGRRNGGPLRIEISEARGPRALEIVRNGGSSSANGAPLAARRIGEKRDLGYLRIKAPLADTALVGQFDDAMRYLKDTRGMILDLRDATGPFPAAARATTLAMLGRFTAHPAAWQARQARGDERVVDTVQPRGPVYAAPVVVLVDRWTAGEGEALAAGLHAIAGARLVGTRMAGLRGELREVRLPNSGIVVRFPGQRTFLPDGRPRESLTPEVLVDLALPQGGPGDPILYQALRVLEKK